MHSKDCCKVSVNIYDFPGLMRPKSFAEVRLDCEKLPEGPIKRQVLMRRWFLRLRLWAAKNEVHVMARKFSKFKSNQLS